MLLNWLENGETPNIPLEKIKEYGFGVVIFPVGSVFTMLTRRCVSTTRACVRLGTPIDRIKLLPQFDDFHVGRREAGELDKLAQQFKAYDRHGWLVWQAQTAAT